MSGHLPVVAYDPLRALSLAREQEFDIAFIDIGLPMMDGHELARRLRQLDSGRRQPLRLVAATGYGEKGDRERSRSAGFDEHLVKPLDFDDVLRAVNDVPPLLDQS